MKIAWVSAWNGQPATKSTYFTKTMLSAVPEWADVTLLVADEKPPVKHVNYLSVAQEDFDLFVFQLDDSPSNAFVLDAAHRFSGFVHLHQYHLPFLSEQVRLHRESGREIELDEKTLDFIRRGWMKNEKSGGRQLSVPEHHQIISSESYSDESNFLCRFPVNESNPVSINRSIVLRAQSSVEDRAVSALCALDQTSLSKTFICYSEEEREQLERRATRVGVDISIVKVESSDELVRLFCNADFFVGLRRDQTRGLPLEHYLAAGCGCFVITSEDGFSGDFFPKLYPHIPVGEKEDIVLRELLQQHERMQAMRMEAVATFRKEHSIENSWSDYKNIFNRGKAKQVELVLGWERLIEKSKLEITSE